MRRVLNHLGLDAQPTLVDPAAAAPSTVTATSTQLSVLGDDPDGESGLVYSWSIISKPSGAADPVFSANASNAASSVTASFSKAGTYLLRATISDGTTTLTSDVSIIVEQTFSSISLSPATANVAARATQQFTAVAKDQFGNAMAVGPQFTWSLSGSGSLDAAGLYTAPATDGSATVSASATGPSGTISASATVNVRASSLHLTFDETSGTTAVDSSGNGNNATLYNGATFVASGRTGGGNALYLDGSDDYAQIADASTLDGTGKLSIALWVNPSVLDGQARGLISKRISSTSGQSFSLFFHTGNKLYIDIDGSNNRFASNTVFSTDTWYHIAVVYDGSAPLAERVKLYVNGVLDQTAAESSGAIPNYSSNLTLGVRNAGYATKFAGLLDDVLLYRDALDALEVSAMMLS